MQGVNSLQRVYSVQCAANTSHSTARFLKSMDHRSCLTSTTARSSKMSHRLQQLHAHTRQKPAPLSPNHQHQNQQQHDVLLVLRRGMLKLQAAGDVCACYNPQPHPPTHKI